MFLRAPVEALIALVTVLLPDLHARGMLEAVQLHALVFIVLSINIGPQFVMNSWRLY
jgi:hypothetical protein